MSPSEKIAANKMLFGPLLWTITDVIPASLHGFLVELIQDVVRLTHLSFILGILYLLAFK